MVEFDRVEHGVGKDSRQAATDISLDDAACPGGVSDMGNRHFHGVDKPLAQRVLLLFVLLDCSAKFDQGFRVKLDPHRAMTCRTSLNADSAETVLTAPLRTSSRRRFASCNQRSRIRPSSAGSRLSTSRSASRARASLGSARASSAICSTVMRMAGSELRCSCLIVAATNLQKKSAFGASAWNASVSRRTQDQAAFRTAHLRAKWPHPAAACPSKRHRCNEASGHGA